MLDALRLTGALPARRALVGIEPSSLDWGTEPTPPVNAAIPGAVGRIQALLSQWRVNIRAESAA